MLAAPVQLRAPRAAAPELAALAAARRPLRASASLPRASAEPRDAESGAAGPSLCERLALPAAALFAAAALLAATPAPAEAARSGGRMGGSSFGRSMPRAAPRMAAPRAAPGGRMGGGGVLVAPPIISPYHGGGGYMMGGYGGFMPFPMVGGGLFFNLIALSFIANIVLGVVRGITDGSARPGDGDESEGGGRDTDTYDKW
jgi:uncharacterized membrane protein